MARELAQEICTMAAPEHINAPSDALTVSKPPSFSGAQRLIMKGL